MTNGTSQGLFVVVAIVIFGIFVALSYTVFGNDGLSGGMVGIFDNALAEYVDSEYEEDTEEDVVIPPFDMSHAEQWQSDEWVFDEEQNTITFSDNRFYMGGILIPAHFFEEGKSYTMTFDITKLSGDIEGIGGHLQITPYTTVHIDGVEYNHRWWNGESTTNPWNSAVVYSNSSDTHSIEVNFTYDGTTSSDRNVYIQPNRRVGAYSERALNYRVQIADLEIIVHD